MLVGIDQRRQRDRAFDRRIEPDAQFAHEVEVRPEARRDDEFVDDDLTAEQPERGGHDEARAVGDEMRNAKFAFHLIRPAAPTAKAAPSSPRATSLSFAPPPKALAGSLPRNSQIGWVSGACSASFKIGQRTDRGMSRSQHRDRLAGIARAVFAEHVRHAVSDPVRGLCLANGGKAIGARRVR